MIQYLDKNYGERATNGDKYLLRHLREELERLEELQVNNNI
jgi:hypothetical protein